MRITWFDELRAKTPFTEMSKFPKYLYHKVAQELWRKSYILNYRNVENPVGRALVLELVRPFYRSPTEYDPRPGRWSKIKNVELLNELGFAVDIYDLSDTSVLPEDFDQYDLLFGSGPKFEPFSNKMSLDTTKIFYTGGAHHEQRAEKYLNRLRRLNRRQNTEIQPGRPGFLNPYVTNLEQLDAIIAMGDNLVGRTYSTRVETPTYTVRTTHTPYLDFDINSRDYDTARAKFLWFGGLGPIIKGLDLVLEAFADLPSVELYVVGPYEHHHEFVDVYQETLSQSDNIHTLGHVDIRSSLFERLVRNCAFLVYPGASEGSSGAVAACMWRGLIPIITPEVIEETSNWGITLSDDSIEEIRKTVQNCAEMPAEEVKNLSEKTYKWAHKKYDRDLYSERFREILLDIFRKTGTAHTNSAASKNE